MNQRIAFYLLSIIVIFFIGYSYSQFNTKPADPVIITIGNSDEVEQYKSHLLNLQLQLDELDAQLVTSLDELNTTKQKLILSTSKVQVIENELRSSQENSKLIELENTLKKTKDTLSNSEMDLELTLFELELANEHLQAQ
jgi:hypothetical protein